MQKALCLSLFCTCFLLLSSLYLACHKLEAQQKDKAVYAINFSAQQNPAQVIYFKDLEVWARNRNLVLLPDLPLFGLQDFEGMAIPNYGVSFHLDSPRDSRVFLVLDFATYQRQKKLAPDWGKLDWLEVKVGGNSVAILNQGKGQFLPQPVVLTIEKEWLVQGRLDVFLQASPRKASTFIIWDAFVQKQAPSHGTTLQEAPYE